MSSDYDHHDYYLRQGMPKHMLETLEAYRDQGRPVGDFLRAVISNDLMEAAGRADIHNIQILHVYAAWLYNDCPSNLHGSAERYEQWINKER